jgi:PHD/YefM family antitoxin component YafN of YafNO toxin-antitoxin module
MATGRIAVTSVRCLRTMIVFVLKATSRRVAVGLVGFGYIAHSNLCVHFKTSQSVRKASNLAGVVNRATYPTVTVLKAQKCLPKLCRDKKALLITTHNQPISVLLPIEDFEALMETMDLLGNPKAMRAVRAAKAGKLKYRKLNLFTRNLGL